MKKLRLEPEALTVESFTTFDAPAGRGTVAANGLQPTLKTFCGSTWLETNPTCCPCTPRNLEP